MSEKEVKNQIEFGVFVHGVNFNTIWHWPESGDQTAFESFRRVAQTAERGVFAALFLGEGLRLREHLGQLHQLDVVGRPDAQTQQAALAAVTKQIGLVATQSTASNDPADFAYRLGSLNQLSGGRNAWNIVTTHNAWTGANFRRGGFLADADRYRRADAFITAVKQIWAGAENKELPVTIKDEFFDIEVARTVPIVPGGRPVLFQAGDSAEGRDLAVKHADVIFSHHALLDDARGFAKDIAERLVKTGRKAGSVKAFPGAQFVIGDTVPEALEKLREIQLAQVTPQTALAYLEQFWGQDLSGYDPDGALPDVDPIVVQSDVTRGAGFQNAKAKDLADQWRAEA